MDLELKGKVAIVTGGAQGIGLAVTEMLAEEGCSVVICDIDPISKHEALVQSISASTGTDCMYVNADVSSETDIKNMNDEVLKKYGGYDILINNAAIVNHSLFCTDMSLSEWEKVIQVNLTGVFLTSRAAITHFREKNKGGRIINMVSQTAFRGTRRGHSHYGASKAGIVGLTRSLALETAGQGICINCVAPGIVETVMMAEKIEERRELYNKEIPMGRIATPKDVAYGVVFLASVMGGYITGSTLDLSGGMMLR